MSQLVEELNINSTNNSSNKTLELSDLNETLNDTSNLDEEDIFQDMDNEEYEVESLQSPVSVNDSDNELEVQQGGASLNLDDSLEDLDNNASDSNNSESMKLLELERGSMIHGQENEKLIIVKIGDVFFDESKQEFVRKYKVREMVDNKLSSQLQEIGSDTIDTFMPADEVRRKHGDLEYQNLDDKDDDLDESNELEELDPLPDEDIIEEMDLDIEIESNSLNSNANEEGFEFEEAQDGDVVISIEQELDEKDILFTENEQEEDIIDELIRNLPMAEKQNRSHIKRIIKLVRNLQYLKYHHSLHSSEAFADMEEDDAIDLKKKIKIKTQQFKPLLERYKKHNYSCKFLIPIINSNPQEYYQSMDGTDADKLNPEIVKQIQQIDKIEHKYKNNKELDYEHMADEIDNLVRDKVLDNKHHTQFITRIPYDCMVINNLDLQSDEPLDFRILLGDTYREDALGDSKKVYQAERVNLVGYLKVPLYILDKIQTENGYLSNRESYPLIMRYFREAIQNNEVEHKTLNHQERFRKGDKVRVCIYDTNPESSVKSEKISVTGTIQESRRGFIYLEPDDKKIIKNTSDILEFDTNSKLLKISKVEDIKSKKDTCDSKHEKFMVYEFNPRILDSTHHENMLAQVLPSIKQIMDMEYLELKSILNLHNLDQILDKYGLRHLDLEYQNYDRIQNILYKNHKKIHQVSQVAKARMVRMKANYDKNLKQEQDKRMKNDTEFVNNLEIESTDKVYPPYLHRIHSFDNELERVAWLENQEDHGRVLSYQKILKQIEHEKTKMKISNLKSRLEEAQEENAKIKIKLDEEERKKDFFAEEKCQESKMKIVKIYQDENELKSDNFRKVTVDEHFMIGEADSAINLVKINDYCILKSPNDSSLDLNDITVNDTIFKRVSTSSENGKEFWSLQSRLNIIDYLKMARQQCNQMLGVKDSPGICNFNEGEMKCLPDKIDRLRRGFENNEQIIQKIETLIEMNNDSDRETKIELELKRLKLRGKLNMKNNQEKKKNKIRKLEELKAKFPVAFDTSENNHYQFLKDLEDDFHNPEKRTELLLQIRDTYGIDFIDKPVLEGEERELFTQGDFNEAGQRIELTEVMPSTSSTTKDKEPIESSNNEILDAIKNYLQDTIDSELSNVEEDDNIDIVGGVIDSLVKIMGLNLDTERIKTICGVLVEDKLISKSDFITQKYLKKGKSKPKQSKVDSQYENYKNQILIFFTAARLLIFLQLNLTNYFMLPYQKCVSSIYGYPLKTAEADKSESVKGDKDMTAINYVSCILENLKKSGKYWSCIEEYNRSKISKKLVAYLEIILENSFLENELLEKYEEMEKNKKQMELIEEQYVWHQFRPALATSESQGQEPPVIDLGDTKVGDTKAFQNAVKLHQQRNQWLSLQIIDKLNSIISNQEIENIKYDPLPIANSCCLTQINSKYNYQTYFQNIDKSHQLQNYVEESRNMSFINQQLTAQKVKLVYIAPQEFRKKYKSFQHQTYLPDSELKKNTQLIQDVFSNYIANGFYTGRRRAYDKFHNCMDTGTSKKEIESQNHTFQNYQDLISNIHQFNNQGFIHSKDKVDILANNGHSNFEFIWHKLQKGLSHPILLENEFIQDLVENEISKVSLSDNKKVRIWESLDREVRNMETELLSKLSRNLEKGNLQTIKNILANMENYDKLEMLDRKNLEIDVNVTEKNLEDSEKMALENIKYQRLSQQMIKFINNYFLKYLKVLSRKQNIMLLGDGNEDDDEVSSKKNNKILLDILSEEYEPLTKYNNKKCRKIFQNLKKTFHKLEAIKNIQGYQDVVDCQNKLLFSSKFTHQNSYLLLKLIFLYVLDTSIEQSSYQKDSSKSKKKGSKSVSKSPSSIDDDEEDISKFNIGTTNSVMISNYVLTILRLVEKDRIFTNKYSQTFVEKVIKTKNEESKDKNLYVMELLDLETRRLRNEQTRAGLAQYAELATDFQDVIADEENNKLMLAEYKERMGSKFNENDFEDYKENFMREQRLEMEIRKDNEVYLDAEGDEELEI